MANIVRLTTPTIKYGFNVVNVAEIVAAYLTVKQSGTVIIEKDLSEATVGEKTISWRLTQQETKLMREGKCSAMLNWKTTDGTRGVSGKTILVIDQNDKDEVI